MTVEATAVQSFGVSIATAYKARTDIYMAIGSGDTAWDALDDNDVPQPETTQSLLLNEVTRLLIDPADIIFLDEDGNLSMTPTARLSFSVGFETDAQVPVREMALFADGGVRIDDVSGLVLTNHTTGGSLVPGTYGYKVTALTAIGETDGVLIGAHPIVVPAGTSTNRVTLTWSAVTGATGYRVYGRTDPGELRIVTLGAVTTYDDLGTITPSGAPSSQNTTANNTGNMLVAHNFPVIDRSGGGVGTLVREMRIALLI